MKIYVGDDGEAFGTGNPWFIIQSGGIKMLVDTPNDPSRFPEAYLPYYIWITHLDGDHIGGLKRIIQKRSYIEKNNTIIFCPAGTESILAELLEGVEGLLQKDPLLYELIEVKSGDTFKIENIEITARRAIHHETCYGLIIKENNKTVMITGDHYYNPKYIKKLYNSGKISTFEYHQLLNYKGYSLIFHDVGSVPYHTPIEMLRRLPEEIQKKIVLYHTRKEYEGFKVAKPKEVYVV